MTTGCPHGRSSFGSVFGDWKMSDIRMACAYVISQARLIVSDDDANRRGAGGGLTMLQPSVI
jgi:hypothetical protein